MKGVILQGIQLESIRSTERALTSLFATNQTITGNLTRWFDEQLTGMHDHNFFSIEGDITEADICSALSLQAARKDDFIKFEGHNKITSKLAEHFNLEEECTLTMARSAADSHGWTTNPGVYIKNLHDDAIADDLLDLELEIFGSPKNSDFIHQKMKRYFGMVAHSEQLNFYAAYTNDHIAGSLFTFCDGVNLAIDGLAVRQDERHKYVATTLIKHVVDAFGCPSYLHVSESENSKNLYANLGFTTVDFTYEYFATLTPDCLTKGGVPCK